MSTLLPLPADGLPTSQSRQATQLRLVSVFRQGWIPILVALLNHHCSRLAALSLSRGQLLSSITL